MGEKVDIWLPLYVRDYLADTARLTTEQHGAYLLLIFDYWISGPLPDDDDTLMRITRLSSKSWRASGQVLRAFFYNGPDGRLCHKRIDAELAKATLRREVAVSRAKKGADSRWSGHSPSTAVSNPSGNAPSIHQAVPDPMLEQCPSPSPSPSPSESAKIKAAPSKLDADASPTLVELPLTGGAIYGITEHFIDEMSILYPAVDVRQQCRNMRGWLISEPRRRKTRSGIVRFVTGWLAREQNKGGKSGTSHSNTDTRSRNQRSNDAIDEALDAIRHGHDADPGGSVGEAVQGDVPIAGN